MTLTTEQMQSLLDLETSLEERLTTATAAKNNAIEEIELINQELIPLQVQIKEAILGFSE